MRHFKMMSVAAVGVLMLSTGFARAAGGEDVVVGKLTSANVARYHGYNRYVLVITSPDGKPVQVGVENKDEKSNKPDPKADLLDEIKAVSPGDMVKVIYYLEDDKSHMMRSLAPYAMEPGMELPNAFTFKESYDHSDNKNVLTLVDVKRFDKVISFAVPNKRDAASGKMAPDPALVATMANMKEGQVVLIDATNGNPYPTMKSIEAYTAPQTGTLKEIKPAEVDGNKTTEADIDVDGTPVTALVPGKLDGKRFIVDTKVLGALKRFKPGTLVTFRVAEENGHSYLRDIKAAPKVKPTETANKDKDTTMKKP